MPKSASHAFAGYIGHYPLTEEKWDPSWWDFKDYCQKLRGEFVFPLYPRPPKKDQIWRLSTDFESGKRTEPDYTLLCELILHKGIPN